MSDCERYEALISELLDGELSAAEEAEVRAHMAQCAECAAMYEAFSAVGDALRADAAEVPDTLHDGIMAKVAMAEKAKKTQNKIIRLRPMLTAAACLVVLVGTLLALKNNSFRMGASSAAPKAAEAPAAMYATGGASAGSADAAVEEAPAVMAAKAAASEDAGDAAAESKTEAAVAPEEPKSEFAADMAMGGGTVNTSADGPLVTSRVETLCFTMRLDAVTDDGLQGTVTDPDVQPWLAEGDAITVLWDGDTEDLAPGTVWTVTVPAYDPPENGTIRALALAPAN